MEEIVGRELPSRRCVNCPRDVTTEVVGVSGRKVAGMPALTRNRFGCGTDWYPAAKPDQAGRTTRMDFILAEVDLPQADAGMTHPETTVANARDECVFLQNDGGKP